MKPTLNTYLFGTVFITGAAVLIIEVSAVRILSPVYGSSLYVLSSILTVILTALSLGYWYGGKRADKEQSVATLYSFITISGLSILGFLLIQQLFSPFISNLFSPVIGPLVLAFVLFFLPAFLLGIVSPYIIKLQALNTPTEKIGSVVGATFFWGTFGSIVGSLLTGFILIPQLGVTKTIIFTGVSIIILGLVVPLLLNKPLSNRKTTSFIGATLLLVSFIFVLDQHKNNNYLYSSDGLYSQINVENTIINGQPARLLLRDSNNSSAIYLDSKNLPFRYTRFSLLYEKLVPDATNMLMLGGGAYTVPRTITHFDPELNIDVVEIEPELFAVAKNHFDLTDTSSITNYSVDARVFLQNQTTKKYDFIFSDLFGTDLAPPFHLTTLNFNQLLKNSLSPEGILMINIVGKPMTDQPSLIGSFIKTVSAVFPNTRAYHISPDTSAMQNVLVVARNSETPIAISPWDLTKLSNNGQELAIADSWLAKEIIFTDDRAPVTYLMTKQF